jgi:hypothetical protein
MMKCFYLIFFVHFLCPSLVLTQTQWELLGLQNENLTKVIIHPNNSQTLYVGSRSDFSTGSVGCFFKSTNSGTNWDTIIVGITVRDIVINPFNPEIIYIAAGANAGNQPGVLKTTDNGATWFNADSGVVVNWETNVNTIRMDPNNQEILFCGTGGFNGGNLFKTTNGGNSWYIPCEDSIFAAGVEVIEFDPYEPIVLYVGRSWDGKLSRSSDGGVTWEYAGYTNGGSIIALQFGRNSDEMYIASSWSFAYPVGIFKTTDRGTNWNNIGQGFEGYASVNDVKVYLNSLEHIYIGLDAGEDTTGMYVKKNDQQWEHYGLTDIIISSIAIENNLMYAATDSGLYVRDFLLGVDPEINNHHEIDYLIYPAYPNPFNSEINITFKLFYEFSEVRIEIIDILGNSVKLLNSNFKKSGEHKIAWKGKDEMGYNVASGIYLIKYKFGNNYDVQKILYLK